MYGFGDDRNPANDTVNVMEEILIEYIIDVVRPPDPRPPPQFSALKVCAPLFVTVSDGTRTGEEGPVVH